MNNGDVFKITNYISDGGKVGIGTTSPYAKLSIHANNGETNDTLFSVASSTASATSTLFTILNTGNVGVGVSSPARKFSVFGTSANPQLRVSYDATNYSELTVSATGDLTLSATGGDIYALEENLRICAGGACPSDPSGFSGNGNILAEGALYAMSSTATSTFAGGMKLNKSGTGIEFYDGTIQTTAAIPHGKQKFTSSDTFTVPAGVTTVYVTGSGGGGGGGSGGGGGNSGGGGGGAEATTTQPVTVTPGSAITVTIGAGGAATAAAIDQAGNNGGNTTFGALLTLNKGLGGCHGGCGGWPGGAAGGWGGAPGGDGTAYGRYGGGGWSLFGTGGLYYQNPTQLEAKGYGSGGTSAPGANAGRAGAPGFLIVEW